MSQHLLSLAPCAPPVKGAIVGPQVLPALHVHHRDVRGRQELGLEAHGPDSSVRIAVKAPLKVGRPQGARLLDNGMGPHPRRPKGTVPVLELGQDAGAPRFGMIEAAPGWDDVMNAGIERGCAIFNPLRMNEVVTWKDHVGIGCWSASERRVMFSAEGFVGDLDNREPETPNGSDVFLIPSRNGYRNGNVYTFYVDGGEVSGPQVCEPGPPMSTRDDG